MGTEFKRNSERAYLCSLPTNPCLTSGQPLNCSIHSGQHCLLMLVCLSFGDSISCSPGWPWTWDLECSPSAGIIGPNQFIGHKPCPVYAMLEMEWRALCMAAKHSSSLVPFPDVEVLTEYFGKARREQRVLYERFPFFFPTPCYLQLRETLNKPPLPKWDKDTVLYSLALALGISYHPQHYLHYSTSLDWPFPCTPDCSG